MMNHRVFRFKQCAIDDSRCAMKVGTDAVILGAWANICNANTVLDIGTGCGLIALMIAQRCNAQITAIDIDENAFIQSKENFLDSPWSQRLKSIHGAVQQFDLSSKYDFIISNPPFFKNALKAPDPQRNTARHNDKLSFESLLDAVNRLLNDKGIFSFILPVTEANQVITLATAYQLYPIRCCEVFSRDGNIPNRLLVELTRAESSIKTEKLIIRNNSNQYTLQYKQLTKDFYL